MPNNAVEQQSYIQVIDFAIEELFLPPFGKVLSSHLTFLDNLGLFIPKENPLTNPFHFEPAPYSEERRNAQISGPPSVCGKICWLCLSARMRIG